MSDYCVSIGNKQYQVKINGKDLFLDGESVPNLALSFSDNGLHILRYGDRFMELCLQPAQSSVSSPDPNAYDAFFDGRRIAVRVESSQNAARRKQTQKVEGDLLSPMPGAVVEVLVKEGDVVAEGQALVVLESMKMHMHLRAPVAGRVAALLVKPGQQVEKGALLVQCEPNDTVA